CCVCIRWMFCSGRGIQGSSCWYEAVDGLIFAEDTTIVDDEGGTFRGDVFGTATGIGDCWRRWCHERIMDAVCHHGSSTPRTEPRCVNIGALARFGRKTL